ncbi:MAG: hypothetical protein HYZ28_05475 [Myxococcales bacterium]|nr:hypothetical protein [Myxococcales bacterium]
MTAPSIRRALRLLPPCATTGIGSLPHTQQELALQMALQVDVPYLPQLPSDHPSELMIPSALEGLPGMSFDGEGLCLVDMETWLGQREGFGMSIEVALQSGALEAFEPSSQACRAWKPFLWEVETRKLPFAKVQIAGPCTVRWVAMASTGKPASEVEPLDQQIFRLLLAKSMALVRAVRKAGATPILFLDEPGLYALDRRNPRHLLAMQELRMLALAIQREGGLVGVHCCSNTDWQALLELGLDVLSIDVRLSLDAVLEEQPAFWSFLSCGAALSLGIIPTDLASSYQVDELVEAVEAGLRATVPASDFGAVLSQMLITPACGLAMRSVVDSERSFDELRQAQRLLRQLAAAEPAPSPAHAP